LLKKIIFALVGILFFSAVCAQAAEKAVKLFVSGVPVLVEPGPLFRDGRVFVPVRFVAEHLGAQVNWDDKNSAVLIEPGGDRYLKGQKDLSTPVPGIMSNLVKPRTLKDILDDDKDNSLADYRQDYNGGDLIANDPLIVDTRKRDNYDAAHIPGAVWIAPAENMAEKQNIDHLKRLLAEHINRGGKDEVVIYCSTGHTSGLAAGVLGTQGLPVKNLMYGFDIGWRGTVKADPPVSAPMENSSGETIYCGG
jgi:rhodanese-related sulfurtransferase